MKPLSWVGIVLVVLGLLSFVVPLPHNEHEGFSAGGMSVGVDTHHSETVSPIISAAMILGGAGILIVSRGRRSGAL
jgi:hypothetical protein